MHLSIFNFKPIKWTTIFFLVLVSAIGTFKIWSLQQAEPGLRPLTDKFWVEKTFAPRVFDLVIIGDSRVYRAIAPSVMEQILSNYKILNFGYSSGGLEKTLLQAAEHKLKVGGKKVIVLGVTPYSLTLSAAKNDHYRQYSKIFAYPYQVTELGSLISPEDSVFSVTRLLKKTEKVKYYQVPHSDGWIESNQIPENESSGYKEYKDRFSKEKISNELLKKMIEQVRLWRSQGYTVFAFRPPASRQMEELENSQSGYNETAIVLAINAAGGSWIDIEDRYGYKTYDGSHLNSQSAKRLSEYIAHFIKTSEHQEHKPTLATAYE